MLSWGVHSLNPENLGIPGTPGIPRIPEIPGIPDVGKLLSAK